MEGQTATVATVTKGQVFTKSEQLPTATIPMRNEKAKLHEAQNRTTAGRMVPLK